MGNQVSANSCGKCGAYPGHKLDCPWGDAGQSDEARQLLSRLDSANPRSRDEFMELFPKIYRALKMDSQSAADELGVSRGSVMRWVCGDTAPHPVFRHALYRWAHTKISAMHSIRTCLDQLE